MKMIDADTLIIKVQELIKEYERRMPEYSANDMLTSGKDAAMKWGYKADGVEDVLKLIIDAPIIKAEAIKHGRWIMREKDKLVPTGKIAVSEGYILHKTSFDKPFTLQSANIIKIKEHRTVKIPYCSICGNYGNDEYDKTPYCPYCGARMDGDVNDA